jgi:hypothetical protein
LLAGWQGRENQERADNLAAKRRGEKQGKIFNPK